MQFSFTLPASPIILLPWLIPSSRVHSQLVTDGLGLAKDKTCRGRNGLAFCNLNSRQYIPSVVKSKLLYALTYQNLPFS